MEYINPDNPELTISVSDTTTVFMKNGRSHNTDGPAIIRYDGRRTCYCQNGKYHNEHGPAVITNFTEEEYWLHGKKIYLKSKWEQQVLEERTV